MLPIRRRQFSYIEKARSKGYDVLVMDGQLDTHLLNHLETKLTGSRFVRVDADVIDKLIPKEEVKEMALSERSREDLSVVFESQLKSPEKFTVSFESLDESDLPVVITQSEFMRRMKDMAQMGGGMSFYGELPDHYNIVVNGNNPVVTGLVTDYESAITDFLKESENEISAIKEQVDFLETDHSKKKSEEISTAEKDDLEKMRKELQAAKEKRAQKLKEYAGGNPKVKQLIDLALLANNMLKGEDLSRFVDRSIKLL